MLFAPFFHVWRTRAAVRPFPLPRHKLLIASAPLQEREAELIQQSLICIDESLLLLREVDRLLCQGEPRDPKLEIADRKSASAQAPTEASAQTKLVKLQVIWHREICAAVAPFAVPILMSWKRVSCVKWTRSA
jgi:hypothetical protein